MNNVSRALLRPLWLTSLAGTVLLAGCGGGGGGASLGPSTVVEPDAANAEPIASAVLRSTLSTSSLLIILAAELDESDNGILSSLAAGGTGAGTAAERRRPLAVRSVQPLAAFGPISEDCDISGSVTFSGDVASGLTYTAGDSIRADYTNCDDGNGYELNGRLDFVINSFSGDVVLGSFTVDTDMTLTDLVVTSPIDDIDVVQTWDGEFNLEANTTNAAQVVVAGIADEAVLTTEAAIHDLESVEVSAVLGDVVGFDVEFAGFVNGTQFLGGAANASTDVAAQAPAFGALPTSGTLVVQGDENTLEINIQNGTNVQLEVDGTTIPTTWEALLEDA